MIEYAENDVSRQVSQIQELTAEEVSAVRHCTGGSLWAQECP